MSYKSKAIRLIQLTLLLFITAHTHDVLAEEVEMINYTPNSYVIEYTTWSTDAFNDNGQKLYLRCGANKACKTNPNPDPDETGSMGRKLTGEFSIKDKSGNIVSRRDKLPEAARQYRCTIHVYKHGQKAIFSYRDH